MVSVILVSPYQTDFLSKKEFSFWFLLLIWWGGPSWQTAEIVSRLVEHMYWQDLATRPAPSPDRFLHILWLQLHKMAAFVSRIFWLNFWMVGGDGEPSSITINSFYRHLTLGKKVVMSISVIQTFKNTLVHVYILNQMKLDIGH